MLNQPFWSYSSIFLLSLWQTTNQITARLWCTEHHKISSSLMFFYACGGQEWKTMSSVVLLVLISHIAALASFKSHFCLQASSRLGKTVLCTQAFPMTLVPIFLSSHQIEMQYCINDRRQICRWGWLEPAPFPTDLSLTCSLPPLSIYSGSERVYSF